MAGLRETQFGPRISEMTLPRYFDVPSPLHDLADSCRWVSWLEEYPICVHVVAENGHECNEKSFGITMMFCEDSLEVFW